MTMSLKRLTFSQLIRWLGDLGRLYFVLFFWLTECIAMALLLYKSCIQYSALKTVSPILDRCACLLLYVVPR